MGNHGSVGGDAATGDGGLHAGVHHRVGQHRRNGFTLCIFMHRTIRVKKSGLGFREPNLRFLMVPKYLLIKCENLYELPLILNFNVIKAYN